VIRRDEGEPIRDYGMKRSEDDVVWRYYRESTEKTLASYRRNGDLGRCIMKVERNGNSVRRDQRNDVWE
jgi:hypothetical protein